MSSLELLHSIPSLLPAARVVLIVDTRTDRLAAEQDARLKADLCRRAGLECKLLLSKEATAEAVLELLPKVSIWLYTGSIARPVRQDLAITLAPSSPAAAIETAGELLLSGEERLPAEALRRLNLRGLHMAVFAACSPVESVAPAEGVAALCSLLMTAGARQALATLWPVQAAVAGELVLDVLGAVLPPRRLAVSEAARQALLRRQQLGAPVESWASFAVYGSGDALPL
jgi:hypothetical protein